MSTEDLKRARRESREYKKYLKKLTSAVSEYLVLLDEEMEKPASMERGRRIAALSNKLDYVNDQARYFGLGIDYRNDARRKEAIAKRVRERDIDDQSKPESL